jgi:hypothetical protein
MRVDFDSYFLMRNTTPFAAGKIRSENWHAARDLQIGAVYSHGGENFLRLFTMV